MSSQFTVNRGSDLSFEFNWPDGQGGNADMTGYSVVVFEPDRQIDGLVTAEWVTVTEGLLRVRVEWSDDQPSNVPMRFRIQVSQGEEQQSTNQFSVRYK